MGCARCTGCARARRVDRCAAMHAEDQMSSLVFWWMSDQQVSREDEGSFGCARNDGLVSYPSVLAPSDEARASAACPDATRWQRGHASPVHSWTALSAMVRLAVRETRARLAAIMQAASLERMLGCIGPRFLAIARFACCAQAVQDGSALIDFKAMAFFDVVRKRLQHRAVERQHRFAANARKLSLPILVGAACAVARGGSFDAGNFDYGSLGDGCFERAVHRGAAYG